MQCNKGKCANRRSGRAWGAAFCTWSRAPRCGKSGRDIPADSARTASSALLDRPSCGNPCPDRWLLLLFFLARKRDNFPRPPTATRNRPQGARRPYPSPWGMRGCAFPWPGASASLDVLLHTPRVRVFRTRKPPEAQWAQRRWPSSACLGHHEPPQLVVHWASAALQ